MKVRVFPGVPRKVPLSGWRLEPLGGVCLGVRLLHLPLANKRNKMKYMGSKARLAKDILPIILKDRQPSQWYVEPFAGGMNMIDKVEGNRIANDFNHDLIRMFQALVNGWVPPSEITEQEYLAIRKNPQDYPNELVAFVSIGCSFAGKQWGGYARGNGQDYCLESKNNILKQKNSLSGVQFYSGDYRDFPVPDNSIIYCDPPYAGTTKYKTGNFSHKDFFVWCQEKVSDGHKVFISEYAAPDNWTCIWEKKVNSSLTKDTGSKKNIERLFTLNRI